MMEIRTIGMDALIVFRIKDIPALINNYKHLIVINVKAIVISVSTSLKL